MEICIISFGIWYNLICIFYENSKHPIAENLFNVFVHQEKLGKNATLNRNKEFVSHQSLWC